MAGVKRKIKAGGDTISLPGRRPAFPSLAVRLSRSNRPPCTATNCRRPPLYSGATTGDRTSPSRSWLAAAPARHYGRRGASPLTDRSRRLPPFRSKAYVRAPVCVCVCFAASTRHDRTSWPRPEFGNGFTMDAEARACKVF